MDPERLHRVRVVGRHKNDQRRVRLQREFVRQFQARFARHADIQEYHVDRVRSEERPCLRRIGAFARDLP